MRRPRIFSFFVDVYRTAVDLLRGPRPRVTTSHDVERLDVKIGDLVLNTRPSRAAIKPIEIKLDGVAPRRVTKVVLTLEVGSLPQLELTQLLV